MNLYALIEYVSISEAGDDAVVTRQYIPAFARLEQALAIIEESEQLLFIRILADNLPHSDYGIEAFDTEGNILPPEMQFLNQEMYADEIEYLQPVVDHELPESAKD